MPPRLAVGSPLRERDVGALVEPADAVFDNAELPHPLVVDGLGVALGHSAIGEHPRLTEVLQHHLAIQLGFLVRGVRVVGMVRDVLDGLRVDSPVLPLVAVTRPASAAHQDVHAIVSGHDILLLVGYRPLRILNQYTIVCELVEYPNALLC